MGHLAVLVVETEATNAARLVRAAAAVVSELGVGTHGPHPAAYLRGVPLVAEDGPPVAAVGAAAYVLLVDDGVAVHVWVVPLPDVALELIQLGLRKKADHTYGKLFPAQHAAGWEPKPAREIAIPAAGAR